jgi:hypothetical protein
MHVVGSRLWSAKVSDRALLDEASEHSHLLTGGDPREHCRKIARDWSGLRTPTDRFPDRSTPDRRPRGPRT